MENPPPDGCSELTTADLDCSMMQTPNREEPIIRKFMIVAASVFALASTAFAQQGGTAEQARAMLLKAVAAVKADKAKALDEFNKGEGGFLQGDLYGLTPVSWRDESLGSGSLALRHVILRFRGILWFGPRRSHSSVPTRARTRPPRAVAVKDGRSCGRPRGLSLTATSTAAGWCASRSTVAA